MVALLSTTALNESPSNAFQTKTTPVAMLERLLCTLLSFKPSGHWQGAPSAVIDLVFEVSPFRLIDPRDVPNLPYGSVSSLVQSFSVPDKYICAERVRLRRAQGTARNFHMTTLRYPWPEDVMSKVTLRSSFYRGNRQGLWDLNMHARYVM